MVDEDCCCGCDEVPPVLPPIPIAVFEPPTIPIPVGRGEDDEVAEPGTSIALEERSGDMPLGCGGDIN